MYYAEQINSQINSDWLVKLQKKIIRNAESSNVVVYKNRDKQGLA